MMFSVQQKKTNRQREHDSYALEYHLSQALPSGATVCALYPKEILTKLLPIVAKEKKLSVMLIGGNAEAVRALTDAGVLVAKGIPDVYVGEPAGFSSKGSLVHHAETPEWTNRSIIAIGSVQQFATHLLAKFDMLHTHKVVSEIGVLPYQLFAEEVTRLS